MKWRATGLLLLLLGLALLGVAALFHASYVKQTRHVAQQNAVALAVAYQATIAMHRLDVQTRIEHQVLRPDVLDLLAQANRATADELPLIRGWLYRALHRDYQSMVASGLRQFHFHFPDGRSLLRFHSPTHLDDASLFETRPSVRIANLELRPAVGFESGRVLPGFRYVFPVVSAGRHLGSVELSMPFERIHQSLIDLLPPGDYALLLHSSTLTHLFDEQRAHFMPSGLHADYHKEDPAISLVSRAFRESDIARQLNSLLRQDADVQAQIATGTSFTLPLLHGGQGYVASFHSIQDLAGQHAAYIVAYAPAPVLLTIRNAQWRNALIVFSALLLLTGAVWLLLRHRQRLADEKALLQTITDTMSDGLCVIDTEGKTRFVNRTARELTGYSEAEWLGQPAHDLIHRHAGNGYMPADDCAVVIAARTGGTFDGERTFRSKTGRIFPVDVSCRPLLGPHGPVGAVTLFRDTSAVRETLQRMRLQSAALDAIANAIVITDAEAHIEWANPAFTTLTGYTLEEAKGKKPSDLVRSGLQTPEFYQALWQTVLAGQHWQGEVVNRKKNGELYHEQLDITPVLDASGVVRHFVAIKQDISARKRLEVELQQLATTDALTGVANRRHFMQQLHDELERVRRYGVPASLLMFDLDHFKRVNDTHGHAAGDAVLRHCATLAMQRLRSADVLGRIGGEEFCLLLPHTDLDGARQFADSLRQQLAATPCPGPTGPISVTASIGIAVCDPAHADDLAACDADAMLARADRALYRAKAAGRNRVEADEAAVTPLETGSMQEPTPP